MQLPETPPPPLAPLWDRVLRARALPPDLDVDLLYIAIRDRLSHPEWEVRLHALRVLADLLPLSGNALSFPFDQVIDNLGHGSPNVRKAALDALKVFCTYCEDTECAANAIVDKCSYSNIRPHSASVDTKVNVITGLVLSIPSMMAILKRRSPALDIFPVFNALGDKLFDSLHRDVALRSLMKLRRVCGPRDYMLSFSRLDPKVQDKFHLLCEKFDEDSLDVYYGPRRTNYSNGSQPLAKINQIYNNNLLNPIRLSSESSSEDSFTVPYYTNNYAKVIIETEIKFDSDTAITMTVLEQNETESEKNTGSDDDDSIDRNMLKYSDGESEDSDVVVKKVRFGGESVKIRTPDSDNIITSEDDNNHSSSAPEKREKFKEAVPTTPSIISKINDMKREANDKEIRTNNIKKSAIPLPVINSRPRNHTNINGGNNNTIKTKSKSLSELYDFFKQKTNAEDSRARDTSKFALTLSEVRSPEKIPSPVETHKEVEVLHNLQRSPTVSPRRQQTRVHIEKDGFVLNLVASSPPESLLLSPQQPSSLRKHYDWEDLDIVPPHVCDQLHNTENWIAAVKAADQLHSTLLEADSVRRVEPAALSLVEHMWALSEAVPATRAPAEGAVCALVRGASSSCTRLLLPSLVARTARDPPPSALPHALLQRLALHHLIDLIFEPDMIGVSEAAEMEASQLRAALCVARAAGPAAVLAAVRRRLAGTPRADIFCQQLRERLNKPIENIRPSHFSSCTSRSSQLPVAARRARSTPPAAPPPKPRRLRPLPDSAPLPGNSQPGKDLILKTLSPIALSDRDSSALANTGEEKEEKISIDNGPMVSENADDTTKIETQVEEVVSIPSARRSPSLLLEDHSKKSSPSLHSVETEKGELQTEPIKAVEPQKSSVERSVSLELENLSGKSSVAANSKSVPSSPVRSGRISPETTGGCSSGRRSLGERDVRTALAECIMPARHEDWEAIVTGLMETEQMAMDITARAPASSWRAAARSTSAHVRSLRSKVARAACSTLGALFEYRGRALDPELDEATGALLERCADVNRFLRADATNALKRIACGTGEARAAVALARRGVTHRAGPVRAAVAQALAALVRHNGASRTLDMPPEPRTMLLRAAGELLGDASAEARAHARHLWIALADDARFPQMLKDAMPPTRYRAIEKYVEKLRCR